MQTIHGFELLEDRQIPELNTKAQLYRHEKTGAQLLSLQNDDANKVFGITFRTPPADSTGIAHIMEHAVLGGSRKYPVKEPFVELIKGSLKTFVNAMTYPDRTVYPVASTNAQDFYNLVDVYLDAVFYPLITPYHLDQEGWHYELESLDAPLTYKGVVFNEMKGAYSSPDGIFARNSRRSLFTDHTYALDSGGDPEEIPNLTYERFREFHDTYYHPSNAYIYFYGDDDPAERLRLIDEYLNDFDAVEVDSAIPIQSAFTEPQRFASYYSVDRSENGTSEDPDGSEKKSMVQLNWLLPAEEDPTVSLALDILSYALLGTSAAPLRKRLTDSGLGEDVMGGFSEGMRHPIFSIGMKGVDSTDLATVEQLILDELTDLANSGIDQEMIEAALNTIEFALRENNSGSYPRGLLIMLHVLGTWIYDQDPIQPLLYEKPLREVKERFEADNGYAQKLIHSYLLGNSHRTTTTIEPKPGLDQEAEAVERARLDAAQAAMTEADLQKVMENAQALKALQEAPDEPANLAKIPRLKLEDLDQEGKEIPIEVRELNGSTILYHDLFTNGIVYLDVGFDLHQLPVDLLPYLRLFARGLTEMGTEREDYVTLSRRIDRTTGGIGASNFVSAIRNASSAQDHAAWLFLGGKSMPGQAGEMLEIMREILLTVDLDNKERFRQMVLESKVRREAGLIPSGHSVVAGRLEAQLTAAGWIDEQMGGIDNLFFLRSLTEEIDSDWPSVRAKLEQIRSLLVNRNAMLINVTLDSDNWRELQPQVAEFVDSLPAHEVQPQDWTAELQRVNEGLTIPAQVNYVAKGARIYDLGYDRHGSVLPITNYLRTTWLWEKVRIQGGAYGGFCRFTSRSGVFSFLSYRDPNLLDTVDVYDQTATFLRNLDLNEDELIKSIIGTIGQLDSYQLPDAKGYTSMVRHLLGETAAERQRFREEVLATSRADFRAFADVLDAVREQGTVAILGSKDAIEQANSARKAAAGHSDEHWLQVTKVL